MEPKIRDLKSEQERFFKQAFLILLFLLFARIISMIFIPLNDSTESRYGEIARKMLETGDWLVLHLEYGIPFWAKPPLSTWLSAFSMKCFGVNEFAVRLPGLLLSIGILWLIWDFAKKHSNAIIAMAAVLILSGSLYFFLDAGTVMTDPALLFCNTLAMISFWRASVEKNILAAYLFFISLGLGLLAKGPIILVLVGLPLFTWVLQHGYWAKIWRRLPWIQGLILIALIAFPWYFLVEQRTPGFLNYFIVGEHFQRFLIPGWTGDKYGIAHNAPWGMIWVYIIIGIFPWNLIGCVWLKNYWKKIPDYYRDEDGWMSYLLCWFFLPLIFFTFSSNIIYPYVFPVLPAYALIIAEGWQRSMRVLQAKQWILNGALMTGMVFLFTTVVFLYLPQYIGKTQKPIIKAWIKQHPSPDSKLVYWDYGGNYSARFYAAGRVVATGRFGELCELLAGNNNYLVINSENTQELPEEFFKKGTLIHSATFNGNESLLLRFPAQPCG